MMTRTQKYVRQCLHSLRYTPRSRLLLYALSANGVLVCLLWTLVITPTIDSYYRYVAMKQRKAYGAAIPAQAPHDLISIKRRVMKLQEMLLGVREESGISEGDVGGFIQVRSIAARAGVRLISFNGEGDTSGKLAGTTEKEALLEGAFSNIVMMLQLLENESTTISISDFKVSSEGNSTDRIFVTALLRADAPSEALLLPRCKIIAD